MNISELLPGWELRLMANSRSPHTIRNYLGAAKALDSWLKSEGRSTDVADLSRGVMDAFTVAMLSKPKATRGTGKLALATVDKLQKGLRQFFAYLLEEGEIAADPMAKMPRTKPAETMPAVLADHEIEALLDTCRGRTFLDRRDAAILRLMLDTGTRAAETCNITVADVDLLTGSVAVIGKGKNGAPKPRTVVISVTTAATLERYLRSRGGHSWADRSQKLWLGQRGPLTPEGLARMLTKRCQLADVGHFHPHLLRHTWASNAKMEGIQPDEFKALGGWSTNEMPERYGRATVVARAMATGRRISLVERLGR